jgi:PTH2 family peptidyl-tRNA hydrolase
MEDNQNDVVKQVIVMRTKYPDGNGGTRKLRTGKMIAQGAHASMAWLTKLIQEGQLAPLRIADMAFPQTHFMIPPQAETWLSDKFTKITVYVETEEELLALHEKAKSLEIESHLIQDCGLTEFNEVPTYTAVGIGPDYSSKLDPVTGHLPLL